ncbi:SsgA family sporulation/cell division regulator [Streptomyces sp. NPDC004629]|uniref:SsgA family sporulation/cell division regulator n=1 Tax=Streptomyces sp. NPDC004629 TaxID=3364705 RepID=UPI00368D3E91
MDTSIRQPARARLITAEDREVPVSATLRYTVQDPLAVFVDFPPEAALDGEGVTWTFARSLLDAGLAGPAGNGDVRVRPCGATCTLLEFHSPHGVALLGFGTGALRRFLRRSYAVVAAGEEDVVTAVERGLGALFGGV